MEKELKRMTPFKILCPFIQNPPSVDCYCIKLENLSMEAAINQCVKNYEECEVYKSLYGNGKTNKVK